MSGSVSSNGIDAGTKAVVDGNTAFALDLYQQLRQVEGNLFFSPYSISTALAMTYAGARGVTAAQIAETLHFLLPQEALHPAFAELEAHLKRIQAGGDVQLRIANALWPHVRYPFLDSYHELAKACYGVEIAALDYDDPEVARLTINAWAEQKTNGKIKNLIEPDGIDIWTRLVLANAIYFKGNWLVQFDKAKTRDASFARRPGEPVSVPMMAQMVECGYHEADDLHMVELAYTGNGLSMIVLLPRAVDGLSALEKKLDSDALERWIRRLRPSEVHVFLPKFTYYTTLRLEGILEMMGMIDAFDKDRANFEGMEGRARQLYIGSVFQKTFVDVNEEGTEAAAVTAVEMKALGPEPTPPVFCADHPFLFLIRDRTTGSLLFLGRVVDPTAPGS